MPNSCVRVIGIVTLILVFTFGSLTSFAVWSPHWRVTKGNPASVQGIGVMTSGYWGSSVRMSTECVNTDNSLKNRVCWTTLGECWCILDDSLQKLEFWSQFNTTSCSLSSGVNVGQDMVNALWQARVGMCAAGFIMFISLYVACCVIGCANVGSSVVMVVFATLGLIAFAVGFAPAHQLFVSSSYTCNGHYPSGLLYGDYSQLGYAYHCAIGSLVILIVIIILNGVGAKIASDEARTQSALSQPINTAYGSYAYGQPQEQPVYTYGQPQYVQTGAPVYTPAYNTAYNYQAPVTYKQPA